tara:strand:+ start:460 stop:768 length:309 start_codon:yes stop_codon:yes gene_type:complete
MVRRSKWTIEFERKYGDKLPDKKKATISKYFKIKRSLLDEVYDRGRAAGLNTGMRKGYTSVDGWGRVRMYKFILNVVRARKTGDINMGRGQDGDVVSRSIKK